VRELEHTLQSLEVQKSSCKADDCDLLPFAVFFSFPHYSTSADSHGTCNRIQAESAAAGIETTMVEGHASLKVKVQRRPRQLLRLTVGLQQLGLTTLHLNVSTAGATAMYSFSLKVSGGYLFIYIYIYIHSVLVKRKQCFDINISSVK
jgi:hypothetical protein